jgi:beta-galactosidase
MDERESLSRIRYVVLAALMLLTDPAVCHATRERIDLDGTWQFRLDPEKQGEAQSWHSAAAVFDRTLTVPGAWQAQGVGERRDNLRHDYSGAAWYRRTVAVPPAWRGKVVRLRIGGAHRYTTLFVNGKKIGEHRGFSAPFSFDVTDAILPGADNVLAVRIENPGAAPREGPREQEPTYPTGLLNYLGNWGGFYGHVELQATPRTRIEHVYIRPDVRARITRFIVRVQNGETRPFSGEVRVSVDPRYKSRAVVEVQPGAHTEVEIGLPMSDARLWSPEDPHLYQSVVSLHRGAREQDRVEERFGMRQLEARGNQLLLNGQPIYLRGYGDDNVEVLTGFPPSSRQTYLDRLKLVRSFGFNAVRFHSMTPAEDFFHAADEAGVFVMAELPAAYTQYVLPHRALLRQELERVVSTHRNRPSLLSVAFGNEFNLSWLKTDAERALFLETVADFYRLAKQLHPDGLVLSNDGYVMKPTDLVSHFGPGQPDLPTVKHEFGGYYCSLPDISLVDRFTGVFLPEWLHVKRKWVTDNGLTHEYPTYVRNSQRLQHLGRKFQIERVRRQPDVSGYHYWLIVDFPGGTGEGDSWEEGWLDFFWRPKGITPQDGQEINGAVLPLISAGVHDRALWHDEARTIGLIVSNYGGKELRSAPLSWTLAAAGKTVASGERRVDVSSGGVKQVAAVSIGPVGSDTAQKLELVVEVGGLHRNRWSFWSFPRGTLLDREPMPVHSTVKWAGIRRLYPFIQQDLPGSAKELLITSTLDDGALQHLRSGGRAWLMAERGQMQPRAEVSFFPAAGGAQGTMVREHPALEGFPHEGFGDLQFYNLMEGAVPFPLDRWDTGYQPIVGSVRTTAAFLSKSKDLSRGGYVFEVKVGGGSLLVTTLRFREHLDEAYPEVIHLFDRLLRYTSGPKFAPQLEVDGERLQALMPPR